MQAVGYIRVSHKEQVEGHSLDAQRSSIETLCRQRGWPLGHIYMDAGISAKKDSHRPAFEQMLQDAHVGKFQVLVVDKIDRFYRHLRGCLTTLDELNSVGVTFVAVREQLDFTTPWGKLTLTVLGMLAEIYIDNLRQETHKGKYQRARKGLLNGNVPFGYCNGLCSHCTDSNGPGYCPHVGEADRGNGKVIIPHPIESDAVKLMFKTYATGKYTHGDIADLLNQTVHLLPDGQRVHFRPKGKLRDSARPFSKDSVRDMLQRITYTGKVPFLGVNEQGQKKKSNEFELFEGQHPALVSTEVFESCRSIRELLNQKPRQRNGHPSQIYPLSRLLKCGVCGHNMRGTSSRGRRWYMCGGQSKLKGTCSQKPVLAAPVEAQVYDLLCFLPIPENVDRQLWQQVLSPQEVERRQQEQVALEARLERALELYLTGDITRERLEVERYECQHKIALLRPSEISATIANVQKLRDFPEVWGSISDVKKRELLRIAISTVHLHTQRPLAGAVRLTAWLYGLVCSNCGPDEIPILRSYQRPIRVIRPSNHLMSYQRPLHG